MCERCKGQGWYWFTKSEDLIALRNTDQYKEQPTKKHKQALESMLRKQELCETTKLKIIREQTKLYVESLKKESNGESEQA